MGLFDEEETLARPGYRLARLEVYNWGTFDEAVWPFYLDGDTSLLTGDIGTGKSTMVDALLTLLVPQKKISYNKAADSGARERSVTSYVRGYYGKRLNESGIEVPESLRKDRDTYSVILAAFHDEMAESTVTLAEVFWFGEGDTSPSHFFVAAERNLSIRAHFADFGKSMAALKKRLKKTDLVRVFDHFSDYATRFQTLFGIRQEHAMELFQQIVSLKKVNGITEFVRDNMLDDAVFREPVRESMERMLAQYHDLQSIHRAIVLAKEKLERLSPLTKDAEAYLAGEEALSALREMKRGLAAWIALQDMALQKEERAVMEDTMAEVLEEISRLERGHAETEAALDERQKACWASGGERIESEKKTLEFLKKERETAAKRRRDYEMSAKKLGLSVPETEKDFRANRQRLEKILEDVKARYEDCDRRLNELYAEAKDIRQHIEADEEELESLRRRRTNIPQKHMAVREALIRELGADEWEMPFAGELMEVRQEEAAWEGALERLLHDFGLSLLVPEERYASVIRWMETHRLGMSFVYYRVEEDVVIMQAAELPEGAAAAKLRLKEDSPFCDWMKRELFRRFDHICCETLDAFRHEDFALTREGQIKTQGRRHRKDDRHAIDDRRQYVLGFSNKEKIKALEKDKAEWETKRAETTRQSAAAEEERSTAQLSGNLAENLLAMHDFPEMDTVGLDRKIGESERLISDFEKNNDVFRRLNAEIARLKETLHEIDEKKVKLLSDLHSGEKDCAASLAQEKEDARTIAQYEVREDVFAALDAHKSEVWGENARFTTKSRDEKERKYDRWLEEKIMDGSGQQKTLEHSVLQKMNDYLNYIRQHNETNPNLNTDLSRRNINEYKSIEEQIRRDALPRLQPQFRKKLREESIREMALFRSKLENLRRDIGEKIETINESLRGIDYDPGHYIRIEYTESANSEIKDFRKKLLRATDNTLAGDEDHYSEQKFQEIEEIIGRFDANRLGHTEADSRWTARVTDVRNWYLFAVSERIRREDGADGGEYEHYTDSSGKSGGQKEKLAYTILAASFVYSFGIEGENGANFRFAAIDEAFLKSSDESARFGLELFKTLGIQLLLVTPLSKIPTIEPYVSHVGFVSQTDRRSELRNMTIREYREEAERYEKAGV